MSELFQSQLLKAAEVQAMVGVEDGVIVAYGYTYERSSIELWFEGGKLFRRVYRSDGTTIRVMETENFSPDYFFDNVKRLYRDKVNPRLANLFHTFGRPFELVTRHTSSAPTPAESE